MKQKITFAQYHTYWVEGENDEDCMGKAIDEFERDMRYPVARVWYDECEAEEIEDE